MTLFKIDENLPSEITSLFRSTGHDAITVYDQLLVGKPDERLAFICRQEGRVLVTLDLDFADIRAYPPELYSGIIVLRLKRQSKKSVLRITEEIISVLKKEAIANRLWVADEHGLRIKGVSAE